MVELGAVARAQAEPAEAPDLVHRTAARNSPSCRRRSRAARRSPRPSRRQARRRTSSAARAKRTNSSTLSVSARRCASIPSASSASSAPGHCLELERSILRRWPKAASVSRSMTSRIDALRALRRGDVHDRRGDFGRRHERRAIDGHRDPRPWTAIAPRPTAGRRPRCRPCATMRSATSFWNIRVSDRHHGGHAPAQPSEQQAVPTL